ncbi:MULTISPECIES: MMPL family transporter [unclassified Curtobacterium]|uniref:MMPL family transporter n=1 Tax=unclassified Curtobacterium TaxID=257496 RepID=UPI000DAA02D7|nr:MULTISPECIES: MMPL family transporter [unclassified Curtobacterium]PZF36980.1 MMPL family transporter [Curtobacterium sp. MCLR17_053]PZF46299.1 MMPL family transporter [Curtobacterium sp. MCLR17_051]
MPKVLAAIGRFSARHRLIIVAVWLVLFASLTAVTAAGMDTSATGSAGNKTAAAKALTVVNEKFDLGSSSSGDAKTLQLVLQARDGAKVTDQDTAAEVQAVLADAKSLPHVQTVSDPFAQRSPMVSKDGTTVISTLTFSGVTEANQEKTYDTVLDFAADHRAAFHAEVGGHLFGDTYATFGPGEVIGILVAFLVLFLTFGSLLAAGANMLVAISGVAVGTVGVLAYSAINPIQGTTLTLATMLGLAVGIDYTLFILTRFRSELREGRSVVDAIARATGTAGTAVVFAGLTVIIALVGLVVTGNEVITVMGFAGAFSVLIAVLMALTLLPVILGTLGLRALPRKHRELLAAGQPIPQRPANRKNFLRGWARFVTGRPWLALFGAVVVLGLVAAPVLDMKTASNIPGGSDPTSSERKAYDLIVDEFGGIQSPLLVLVQGDDVTSNLTAVEDEITGLDHVEAVVPGQVTKTDDAALLTVIPTGGPIAESTKQLVTDIRDETTAISGVRVEVTGETAIGLDDTAQMNRALITYIIVIVALSFLLLIVMFRSLLVPLFATLGYLFSVGAAFGASVAIFQWGWLDPLIAAPQGDPMLSLLPIILVGVLFGLAMDYQVFLVSRMKEEHSRGLSPKDAVFSGFTKSGTVLVAAATIMAVVFAGFATSEMAVAASIAVGLLVGVLADAFMVRMMIMPALLTLCGEAAWWMPKWMQKVIPNLDTEGHGLDRAPEPDRGTGAVPVPVS